MKKLLVSILAFSVLLSSIPFYSLLLDAQASTKNSTEVTLATEKFIKSIEKGKGISIDDPNVEVVINVDGTTSIQYQISDAEYNIRRILL